MKLNKTSRFLTAIFTVLSLGLTSCGKTAASSDTLRINLSSEPDSFFPWKSAASDTEGLWRNIFEGLLRYDENGTIIPNLAESYEISEDNLTCTFHLRKNIKFHNGKTFTARDAVYTYKNLAGLDGIKPVSSKYHLIESLEQDGDWTFIVHFSEPFPAFPIQATAVILPEGYDQHETAPCGTGPYRFVEYIPNQKLTLKRNNEYWNSERMPQIENIEVFIITDEAAMISALQSDQLDIATMISASNAELLKNDFNVLSAPQNMVQILGMNNTRGPLSNIQVRKAISMAVNKQDIIKGVFNGYGTELYSNFSPILKSYYNDELNAVNPYNIGAAKDLMEKAGFKDGFDITITVPGNYQPHVDTAQLIVSFLSKINIRARIETVEWTTWLDKVYSKADYEMTVIGFTGKLDAADVLRRYYSSYGKNFTRFKNPDFDKAFDLAEKETDTENRIFYYKICQRILSEDVPAVFICDPNKIVVSRKNIKGYKFYPVTFMDFSSIYFE